MAENEKLYRNAYRAKRKKYILYQQIGLGVLAVLLLIFSVFYFKTDKEEYVYYSENGNAVHYAHLTEKGQEYFEVDKLNGSHAYVTSLVEKMSADFTYNLTFDTDKVKYAYTYDIETQVEVLDVASKAPLYNPIVCKQVEPVQVTGEGKSFSIKEHVEIDFCAYDKLAGDFIDGNDLKDTSSTLIVRMSVNVVGVSETFAGDHSDKYVTEIKIPLRKLAFKPIVSSTVPAGEKKILAVSGNARQVFGVLSIVSLVALVLDIAAFTFFVLHTRDNYLNYSNKVEKIRRDYKSYIQKIQEEFPINDSKVLRFSNFSDLLEVRDVVQKPILTYETADKMCTRFVISSDGLVYMYEIKAELDDLPSDNGDAEDNLNQNESSPETDKRG